MESGLGNKPRGTNGDSVGSGSISIGDRGKSAISRDDREGSGGSGNEGGPVSVDLGNSLKGGSLNNYFESHLGVITAESVELSLNGESESKGISRPSRPSGVDKRWVINGASGSLVGRRNVGEGLAVEESLGTRGKEKQVTITAGFEIDLVSRSNSKFSGKEVH
jgi:hypothetical protein